MLSVFLPRVASDDDGVGGVGGLASGLWVDAGGAGVNAGVRRDGPGLVGVEPESDEVPFGVSGWVGEPGAGVEHGVVVREHCLSGLQGEVECEIRVASVSVEGVECLPVDVVEGAAVRVFVVSDLDVLADVSGAQHTVTGGERRYAVGGDWRMIVGLFAETVIPPASLMSF